MQAGEVREMEILPSLWSFRLAHRPHEIVAGRVQKGPVELVEIAGSTLAAVRWEWMIGARQRTLWTEKAYPHRILKWEDGDGGSGEVMQTIRVPYCQLQANRDEVYRRELSIP